MLRTIGKRWFKFRLSIHKRFRTWRGKRYFIKKVRNVRLLLDSHNLVDRHIDTFGMYESDRVAVMLDAIEKHQCRYFLDIGAHWGLYSLLISSQTKREAVKIFLFEPDKINRYQLQANLFLNRMEHLTVFPYGASDSTTTRRFRRVADHNRGASRIDASGDLKIETRRVDDLVQLKNARIAIKMDVEGHEFSALQGMQSLLAHNECFLQIECANKDAVNKLCRALGGRFSHVKSIENDHYYSSFAM